MSSHCMHFAWQSHLSASLWMRVVLAIFVISTPVWADSGADIVAGLKSLAQLKVKEKRVFHFPTAVSLGDIGLITPGLGTKNNFKAVSWARGKVEMDVPPGYIVELDISAKMFQDPKLLNTLANEKIDAVRVSFLSMDTSEEGRTDKVLAYVSKMKNLCMVMTDRSDATDSGIALLAALPKLQSLSCFCTEVKGNCLTHLVSCANLDRLSFWNCALDQKSLVNLSRIKKLASLNLAESRLTYEGVQSVSKCSNLHYLRLSSNPIDDKSCMLLQSLKKLRVLDIGRTKITAKGVKALAGLPLILLTLPASTTEAELDQLRKIFPHTDLRRDAKRGLSSEELDAFAPLH